MMGLLHYRDHAWEPNRVALGPLFTPLKWSGEVCDENMEGQGFFPTTIRTVCSAGSVVL
jgi:hypothetical protein